MPVTASSLITALSLSATLAQGMLTVRRSPPRSRFESVRSCWNDPTCPSLSYDTHMRPKYEDVVFKQIGESKLKLDIYLPEGDQPAGGRPALIIIHAGAWAHLGKTPIRDYTRKIRDELGYAIISIEYRLSGEKPWGAQGDDVLSATKWVKTNGSSYGIDSKRVGCWGESSGGHLCFWLATAGATSSATRVNVAVGMFGFTCFLCTGYAGYDDISDYHYLFADSQNSLFGFNRGTLERLKFHESNPDEAESKQIELVHSAEPLYQLGHHSKEKTPPIFIGQGTEDHTSPSKTISFFVKTLSDLGVTYKFHSVQNGGHGYIGWKDSDIEEGSSFLKLHL